MKKIKCAVACTNSNGEPDFYFVTVKCTDEQYENGDHYDRAKEEAEEAGYDPFLVYDENDPYSAKIMSMTIWKDNNVVSC